MNEAQGTYRVWAKSSGEIVRIDVDVALGKTGRLVLSRNLLDGEGTVEDVVSDLHREASMKRAKLLVPATLLKEGQNA